MINIQNLPQKIINKLQGETPELAVQGGSNTPKLAAIFPTVFGVVWTGFSLFISYLIFGPMLRGEALENLSTMAFPAVFIGIFILIGLGVLAVGLKILLKKGPVFVLTTKGILSFTGDKIDLSVNWDRCNAEMRWNGVLQKGILLDGQDLILLYDDADSDSPGEIAILAPANLDELYQLCKRRIDEHTKKSL